MDRTECALPPPVPSAMGQREAAAPGGEAGARPPPAETCRAGCGVGCRPRAAPAPRPPPEHRPGAGRNRQRRPRDPRPTPPGPGAAEELRGEQERGPCCGRLRGWGSFCTGIKRVFPRIGSPAPFFEGDVREGGGFSSTALCWALPDRGVPGGGSRPGATALRPPATGRRRRPHGTGRAGTRRAEPGDEGRRRHGGSGRSGGGGSGNGDRAGRGSGNSDTITTGVRSRSVRSCGALRQEVQGKVPHTAPPPSSHPPGSLLRPRVGAAAIPVPPHTAGPHPPPRGPWGQPQGADGGVTLPSVPPSVPRFRMAGHDPAPSCCDCFVALPPHTAAPAVVFGKNADRPRHEVQEIAYIPSAVHRPGDKVQVRACRGSGVTALGVPVPVV